MSKGIQSIRGMHDILPPDSSDWQWLEATAQKILTAYGYGEIRMPLVENTGLFKRSIGEVTDIVEKEMYTFDDRNGESLTLRPEGTASCVRSCIQHGLLHNQQQRLWYQGPMFRYERPQKGRYRQFHQIGVETFGIAGPETEAELIALTARLWRELGIEDVQLELNTLGSNEDRAVYREKLVEYFSAHQDQLDEDSQRRLLSNPLRILDSKNPTMQSLIEAAPTLSDSLGEASREHFAQLRGMLESMGIEYVINPRLVRGLDYYTRTVFEWTTKLLGAQGTICAGGRYDGLVEQLGGKPIPGAGFAMGVERLLELLRERDTLPGATAPHCWLVLAGERAQTEGFALAEKLRNDIDPLRLQATLGGGSIKSQMKKADKSGASVALILGDQELDNESFTIKHLRDMDAEQATLSYTDTVSRLTALVNAAV